ncbi:MAG: glycosyltransferase family 2 protein, partial [Gemmataceae bacterium]
TAWVNFLAKRDRPFEILLVDDGSSDDTAKKAELFAARQPGLALLRHEKPQGFGASIRTALARAQHPLFFYSALDYPYLPADLQKLLDRINDVDVVNGCRGALPLPPWAGTVRQVMNLLTRVVIGLRRESAPGWLGIPLNVYGRFVRVLFGVHVLDPESAFKLFRREIFARIPIQSDGPFVHTEILAKANFLTYWMDEIPIGCLTGSTPEALTPPFRWADHWRDLRRVLFHPDFGPPVPEPAAVTAAPTSPM